MKGKVIGVMYRGEWYPCELNSSLEINRETYPTASIDTGFWNDYISGQKGWSISLDGRMNPLKIRKSAFNNIIKDLIDSNEKVDVEFATKTTESYIRYFGRALVKNVNLNAPSSGQANATFSFQGCGKLNYEEVNVDYLINSMPIEDDKPFIVKM